MSDIPRDPASEEGAGLGPNDEAEPEIADDLDTGTDEAGGDDGDSEADEPEAEGDVAAEPPPRRGGGGSPVPRDLRARAQTAERDNAALRRELDELRQNQQQLATRFQADPAAAARAEQEWLNSLELMPQAQAYQAVMQRGRQEFGQVFQNLAQRQEDLADQARFDSSCARSPTREAYRDKTEEYRQQQLRRGFVIGREEAYYLLLGKDTEARANRVRPGQQRAAAARVNGQRTQPTGARSNLQPAARRPAPNSLADIERQIDEGIARGDSVF